MVTFVFAAVAPVILNKLLNDGINQAVVISNPSSPSYPVWETNIEGAGAEQSPIFYDLYFFDLQNPSDVLRGSKPKVIERGPYSYREFYRKFDIDFTEDGEKVSFNEQKYYVFNEATSSPGLSENDSFVVPSPPALAFEYLISTIPVNATVLLETFLQNKLYGSLEKIEAELNAAYSKVSLIPQKLLPQKAQILQAITNAEAEVETIYSEISGFVAQSSPTLLLLKLLLGATPGGVTPFIKVKPGPGYFGWLNDTLLLEVQKIIDMLPEPVPWTSSVAGADVNWTSIEDRRRRRGPDTLLTGKSNVAEIAKFVAYENMVQNWACIAPMNSQNPEDYTEGVDFPACEIFDSSWNSSIAKEKGYRLACASNEANAIQGTNGEMFGRPLIDKNYLEMFVGSIFRTLHMDKIGSTSDWYGVTLDRYEIREADFLNSSVIPSNSAYFSNGPSGLLNLTEAVNSPAFVSYPHFYYAEPSLSEAVDGISSLPTSGDGDAYMTYLDIEPNTGLLARAHKVLQNNFLITSTAFPTTVNDYSDSLSAVCANVSIWLDNINEKTNASIPVPSCQNLTVATEILKLMALNTDWDIRKGNLFMPYAWVRESTVGNAASANDIKTTVYFVQDLSNNIFLYGMITGGFFLAIIAGMALMIRLSPLGSSVEKQDGNASNHDSLLNLTGKAPHIDEEEQNKDGEEQNDEPSTLSQRLLP